MTFHDNLQCLVSCMKIKRKSRAGTEHIVLIRNQKSSLEYPYLFIQLVEQQKEGEVLPIGVFISGWNGDKVAFSPLADSLFAT